MRFSKTTGNITYLGYSAILLTTIYTLIITALGLKTMQMVKYIYNTQKRNG
jgi:hypothetical protein